MKYILLLLIGLIATPAHAAYWVIDSKVPSKSHIAEDLTEQEKVLLGSYGYVVVPDSVLEAVGSKKCNERYTRLLKDLRTTDKNIYSLGENDLMRDHENQINLATKNIDVCLKKEGIDTSKNTKSQTKLPKSSGEYLKLEKRVALLEIKVREIIKLINSMSNKMKYCGGKGGPVCEQITNI